MGAVSFVDVSDAEKEYYMVNVYITGTYKNYAMEYIAVVEKAGGEKVRISGKTVGSQPEAEVTAMGMAIKYVYENGLDAVVYTTFVNTVKWADGEWEARAKRIKDYVRYVKRVRERIKLSLVVGLPDGWLWQLFSIKSKEKNSAVRPANFRVVIKKADGSVLGDFDEKHFYGILADAIYFANWYEKEGKNEKSYYYGCKVERYNVPPA